MRILYVEDEAELRDTIRARFEARGDVVETTDDLDDASVLAHDSRFDVIVLDRMLHGRDSLSTLDDWRRNGISTPVLMLTALNEVGERVRGLESGADDYLGKPFAIAELMARVGALSRRRDAPPTIRHAIGNLVVDTARREASRGGVLLPLRSREYAVLERLVLAAGRVVTRETLREACWGEGTARSNVEEATIASLRRKLGEPALIFTRRGHGYILEARDETND